MLTVIDIIRALSELIEANFPNYPVNDKDETEGFPRPCYFLDVDNVRTTYETATFFREEVEIELSFFAEEIYAGFLDLLKIKSDLQMLLSQPLKIADGCHVLFSIEKMTLSNADKVLLISMSTDMIQEIEEESDLPIIEEFSFEIK